MNGKIEQRKLKPSKSSDRSSLSHLTSNHAKRASSYLELRDFSETTDGGAGSEREKARERGG